jgi:RHS repeat-associated protein
LVTVSDRKLVEGTEGSTATGYRGEVLFASDYYPFGMLEQSGDPDCSKAERHGQMPGREFSAEEYRYGFQGQETDKEWLGGAVSYKYRVHDARIGRFLSVDPLAAKYPFYSPYAFSGNRVIDAIELEGLEPWELGSGQLIDGPFLDLETAKEVAMEHPELVVHHLPPVEIDTKKDNRWFPDWAYDETYFDGSDSGDRKNRMMDSYELDQYYHEQHSTDEEFLEKVIQLITLEDQTFSGPNGNTVSIPYGEEIPSSRTEREEPGSVGGPNDSIHVEGWKITKPHGYFGTGRTPWGEDGFPKDTTDGKTWKGEYFIEINSVEVIEKKK